MRLGSGLKMRISILNTATTEQMGYIFSFFVYTKFTNQDLIFNIGKYKMYGIIK
nr:hypothetical protein [uncultured Anaerobutyricum sp.]